MCDDPVTGLTWAVLLGRWTDFARAAVALPRDADGNRWRASVAPVIGLQAVTFALGDLDRLEPSERALGLDRAEMLIRRHARELHEHWRGLPMHEELTRLIGDARAALASAREGGIEWRLLGDDLVAPEPAALVGELIEGGFAGDLYLPTPGERLFMSSPVAFARGPAGTDPDEHVIDLISAFLPAATTRERVSEPRQVYRQFDEGGKAVRDYVCRFSDDLPAGRPLLVPAIDAGRACHTPAGVGGEGSLVPVVFAEDSGNRSETRSSRA
jgi:hypothetical protein